MLLFKTHGHVNPICTVAFYIYCNYVKQEALKVMRMQGRVFSLFDIKHFPWQSDEIILPIDHTINVIRINYTDCNYEAGSRCASLSQQPCSQRWLCTRLCSCNLRVPGRNHHAHSQPISHPYHRALYRPSHTPASTLAAESLMMMMMMIIAYSEMALAIQPEATHQ